LPTRFVLVANVAIVAIAAKHAPAMPHTTDTSIPHAARLRAALSVKRVNLIETHRASNDACGNPLPPQPAVIDLDRYATAYFVWIANKLTRGASQNYLNLFGVGSEVWRCMVLLAIHETVSAQQVSQIIGMDKASVSRCFKQMVAKKLIALALDPADGRIRLASLTLHGRHIHDQILGIALAREKALLDVLSADEQENLIVLLKRLHENLPAVEQATQDFIADSLARPLHASGNPPPGKRTA
jgi:DNA-binding MarR family transcriptional regulator